MDKIGELRQKLSVAEDELEWKERELNEVETKIVSIKKEIEEITTRIESESLPTGLYNAGYKLREIEGVIYLVNHWGDKVKQFIYHPTLGDLFDAEKEICVLTEAT